MNPEVAINHIVKSSSSSRQGLWVGRVEDIDDPLRMNRVKARIFLIHGDKSQTPTSGLPWAEVADAGGGLHDCGSAGRLYNVGSTVWIMFEMGDDSRPVVVGGRRSYKPATDDLNPGEALTLDGTDESKVESTWNPDGNELPADVFADSVNDDNHPTRTVWNKSFKGHTIVVEDRDESEFLRIVDRAGQVIEMDCPVKKDYNLYNEAQRGNSNAINDSQLPQDYIVDGRASIRIKDIAGQEIVLDGGANKEEIRLVSRNRLGSSVQSVTISSAKGAEFVEIRDKSGGSLRLDPNNDISVSIIDRSGNRFEFDTENGETRLVSAAKASESVASSKDITTGGTLTTVVGGDDSKKVLGNKFLDVLNDLTTNVSGLTSAIMTGAVNVQVVNAAASGDVQDTALNLTASIGGVNIESKTCGSGKMHFGTLEGDIEVDTALGDYRQKVTGDSTLDVSGKINLGSPSASDKASLDSKVQAELLRIKNELTAFKVAYEGHKHFLPQYISPLIPSGVVPCVPGTVPGVPDVLANGGGWSPGPANPGSTSSSKVTISE